MSIPSDQIRHLLADLVQNPSQFEHTVRALSELIGQTNTASVDGANIDLGRAARCGFPEVVFAEGKPADLVAQILKTQFESGQPGLATRVSEKQAKTVCQSLPHARYNSVARTLTVDQPENSTSTETPAQVAIVTAGSCDAPVAQEALETLRWMRISARLIEDVGVAGPQRLQQHVGELQTMKAIVCVAGMEAALPSVVGGYVSCPVIGVPTSVGYGVSLGGITALLSMLTCCASNVVTVNIDGGFRGGYVAGMIARNCAAKSHG